VPGATAASISASWSPISIFWLLPTPGWFWAYLNADFCVFKSSALMMV
jgi:hypothetical protein